MDTGPMKLPLELVFQVMTCLLPDCPSALIPASHGASRLLFAFGLVCSSTRELAVRKLQQHCIYLDSDKRLGRFLLALERSRKYEASSSSSSSSPAVGGGGVTSLFHDIHTLYLAPFGRNIDNLPTAHWTRELFCYTRDTLRRLIVDIPFDSLPPWDDHLNVGPVLREGFSQLSHLEEFVCTRDAMPLEMRSDLSELLRPVWHEWPRLRRLAIHRPMCNLRFWHCVADLPRLERLLLTKPIGIVTCDIDFKDAYLRRRTSSFDKEEQEQEEKDTKNNPLPPPLTLVLADTRRYRVPPSQTLRWNAIEDRDRMRVMSVRITDREDVANGDRDLPAGHSSWLAQTALDGGLWEVDGPVLTGLPKLVLSNHPHISD